MTSDVKIGLLLGLAFIFIIAFIINGLPNFHRNNNDLTMNYVNLPNNPTGIGENERKITREILNPQPSAAQSPLPGTAQAKEAETDVRFTAALPGQPQQQASSDSATKAVSNTENTADKQIQQPEVPKSGSEDRSIADGKIYTVQEGDSLEEISKKFYGNQEGGKSANINRIYAANKEIISSVDDIQVGDKLTIPLLKVPDKKAPEKNDIFSGPMFQRVESIGQIHRTSETSQTNDKSLRKITNTNTITLPKTNLTNYRLHTVKKGENLWQIATKYFGNGNRFAEIQKLNSDVLKTGQDLEVGMKLKIPSQ